MAGRPFGCAQTSIYSATDTSSDRAYLYVSIGSDTLVGSGNSAILRDTAETTYQIEALYFDLIYARSSDVWLASGTPGTR